MAKIVIDPITRIEGHLKIEVVIEGGVVREAGSSGALFRGFELLLKGICAGRAGCPEPKIRQFWRARPPSATSFSLKATVSLLPRPLARRRKPRNEQAPHV